MKVFILFCKANHLLYIVPTWYGSRTCADCQQKFFPSEHDAGRRFLLVTSHLFCLPAYLPACLPTSLPPSLAPYLPIYLSVYLSILYIHTYICVYVVCMCVRVWKIILISTVTCSLQPSASHWKNKSLITYTKNFTLHTRSTTKPTLKYLLNFH